MLEVDVEAKHLHEASEAAWVAARDCVWLTVRGLGHEPEAGRPFARWLLELVRRRVATPGQRTVLLSALGREAFEKRYPGLLGLCEATPNWTAYASCQAFPFAQPAEEGAA